MERRAYLKHLSDFLEFIDIDVEELNLAGLLLYSFDQLWLDDLTRAAPAGTCLDHNRARLVLNGVVKILIAFHFADVA